LHDLIGVWLESRRRLGWVVGDTGAVDADGDIVPEPEWRLSESGMERLAMLREKRRFVPAVSSALGSTAVEGLKAAVKVGIAAVPALVLAWLVGLIENPSVIGFAVATFGFLAATVLATLRLRAVERARNPGLQEIESVGNAFAQAHISEAENLTAYYKAMAAQTEADNAAMEACNSELEAWLKADADLRGPLPEFPGSAA
jgi:hypothetical protein